MEQKWLKDLKGQGYTWIYKASKGSKGSKVMATDEFAAVKDKVITDDSDVYFFRFGKDESWISRKKDSKDHWIKITE